MTGSVRLCVFSVGSLRCGVDVDRIHEVMHPQRMTQVPLVPKVVAGLINLRGRIVTALDARVRLGLPPRLRGEMVSNLVVRTGEGPISLLVDDIEDVIEADASRLESPPSTLKSPIKDVVEAIHKTEDALVLVLNVDRVVQVETSMDYNGSAA